MRANGAGRNYRDNAGGLVLAVSFLAAAVPLSPAHAADAAPGTAPQAPDPIGEIVVTAQHIKENAQKTPIAMSVYSAAAVKENAITDISALSALAPDINFSSNQGSPTITIRGISSLDVTENGDPAVTVDVDGFYLNRPYSIDATMYDIDRIEVLRGPQGTLNGRNSVGGAINIVTAKPTDQAAGYASAAVGNYNALAFEGMVNIPLSDIVQVRAAFLTNSHDGYRNNAPQPNGDDADSKSGRLSIAFEPASNFHGLLTFELSKEGGAGEAVENIAYVYTATGALEHSLPAGINSKTFPIATTPYVNLTEAAVRYNLVYSFPGFDVTALGGYDDTVWHHNTDYSSVANNPQIQVFSQNEYPKTINAELRANSTGDTPFQWQIGAFYFHEKSHLLSYQATPLAGGILDEFLGFVYQTHSSSKAGYAQASYKFTDALKLTAGLRYTSDNKAESGYYGELTFGPASANVYDNGTASSSKVTYHVALDYDLSRFNLLYAKFDTGYKAGGFNFGASGYAPETLTSYEVGSKNRFLNNAVQLNVDAYYSKFVDEQVGTYVFLPNGFANALTENAGASRIYGAEADLIVKIPVIGTFNASVDYLHARYTNFVSVADPSDPSLSGNVQLAGNTPPQSPTWSAELGLEHQWKVLKGTLTGRVQTKFQSASNFSFYNYADTAQPAYTMSNLFLSYAPDQSTWKVSIFAKNIENSKVFSTAQENAYAFAYAYQFYPPRTFGARLEKKW